MEVLIVLILILLSSYTIIYMQMSSAAGKVPAPGQAGYSASKFALNGYFHTLRSEVLCSLLGYSSEWW